MPGLHVWTLSHGATGTLILCFLARVYLFAVNPIINPDGFLYIQQAKALHHGLFNQVLDCYEYLSPYPIFIAMVYRVVGDWVLSAQWINIFFGTLTIIPLYWLLKRFFQDATAWVTAMVYALLPAYVLVSRDVLRGPSFWFFAVTGLYLFVLHQEARRTRWLLLSSICFAMGAWSRIEGSLFIIVSSVFLLFLNGKHRWKDILVFLAPYIAVAAIGILFAQLQGIHLMELLKPGRILSRPIEFFSRYGTLRAQLKLIYDTDLVNAAPYFFPRVRNLVWFIALGTLIIQLAETLLYLFFILLAVGMVSGTAQLRTDRRVAYLWTLSILGLVLLYSQIIYNWAMTSRFLAVFLFPAFIFMGAGIERMTAFLSSRFRLRGNAGCAIMCAIIMALLLPKNLRANFAEGKLVFKQIGSYIAERENHSRPVSVCGAFKRVRAIHFFANVDVSGHPVSKKVPYSIVRIRID